MDGLTAVVGLALYVAGLLTVPFAVVVGHRIYERSKDYPTPRALEYPTWERTDAA